MSTMLGDSLSTSTHHNNVVLNSATSRASSTFAGGCVVEASAASSRIETAGCRELADCLSINTPMAMVAGLTEAAAAMMMRSPQGCSLAFEESPISVLQAFGDDSPTRSPLVPAGSSNKFETGVNVASLDLQLNDASSNNNEDGVCKPAQSDISDGVESFRLPLLQLRNLRRPPLSEESGVADWNGRRSKQQKRKSSCESINREEVVEAEVEENANFEAKTPERDEEPESPTTPCSSIKPLLLECPDAPCISTRRSKELNRQSSLNDTKLLVTTQLKRSASIFMFDKHFEFLREIGRGSYSTVYEARDRRSGAHCAVKMSKRQFLSRDDREHYLREIQSVACLSEHVNVVKYYRSWQQDSHFYIQMELCEGGNLRTLIDSHNGLLLPESKVWNFIKQVASGLEQIHAQGVLHLDIKPENIFVDIEGVLKIGDFGLAVPRNLWDWEEGDGGYVAPELLRDEEPGPEADMYSFGAMVYEWATGSKLPRSGPLREGLIKLPESRSGALENLVRALLNPTPSKRPTASEIINWSRDV